VSDELNQFQNISLGSANIDDDAALIASAPDMAAELAALRAEVAFLRAKLQRVRDWLKYAANSEGGIVADIDDVLEGRKG